MAHPVMEGKLTAPGSPAPGTKAPKHQSIKAFNPHSAAKVRSFFAQGNDIFAFPRDIGSL